MIIFNKYLVEKRTDSQFYSFTGKGFKNGSYVGGHCRWRDDPSAFAGAGKPKAVEVDLPVGLEKAGKDTITEYAKESAVPEGVDVPGFEKVVVGKFGLLHGVRAFTGAFRADKARPQEKLNLMAMASAPEIIRNSVPVQFRDADESDRGKPVKGIVVLAGAVLPPDGKVRPVRITVTVSAYCDFRGDGPDWEKYEIYTLHSINVLPPGTDVKL